MTYPQSASLTQLPTQRWVKAELRNGAGTFSRIQVNFVTAYIVGSVALRQDSPESDLDIAIVIQPKRGKSSLKLSEHYHAQFRSDKLKPRWENRVVDFQFFYPDDPQLTEYVKIELPA